MHEELSFPKPTALSLWNLLVHNSHFINPHYNTNTIPRLLGTVPSSRYSEFPTFPWVGCWLPVDDGAQDLAVLVIGVLLCCKK